MEKNDFLKRQKEAEIQEKLDSLPSALWYKIDEFIPPSEFLITYGESSPPSEWLSRSKSKNGIK